MKGTRGQCKFIPTSSLQVGRAKEQHKAMRRETGFKRRTRGKGGKEVRAVEPKDPWTEREELEMLIAHQKYKNKWSSIAQELKGKSNNSVKNRFYSIFRKIKNKIRRQDYGYESRFELSEAAYFTSMMKQYLTAQRPAQENTGMRGKDFIYSLLKGLNVREVANYHSRLQKEAGKRTSLDELWLEIPTQSADTKQSEPMPTQQNCAPNLFPHITQTLVWERAICTLPLPLSYGSSCLTAEEKSAFQFQAFKSKEPPLFSSCFPCPIMKLSINNSTGLHIGSFENFELFNNSAIDNNKLHGGIDNNAYRESMLVFKAKPNSAFRVVPRGDAKREI